MTTDASGFISLQDYAACRCGTSFILDTSCKGVKVKFLNKNGYSRERELANKYLKKGKVYVVDYAQIGGYVTLLYLEEAKDIGFNSVMFKVRR